MSTSVVVLLIVSLQQLGHAAVNQRGTKAYKSYVATFHQWEDKLEHNMTLKEAADRLQTIDDVPPALRDFVEHQLMHKKPRSFLEMGKGNKKTSQKKEEPYGAIAETMNTLNDLIAETLEKKWNETIRCWIYDVRQRGLIESSVQSIASFNSQATQARANILTSQGKIGFFSWKIPQLKYDLWGHNRNCRMMLSDYDFQIWVLNHDIGIMLNVVLLAQCSGGASSASSGALVQCQTHSHNQTTKLLVRHKKVREMTASLKSPKAKALVATLLNETAAAPESPVSLLQGGKPSEFPEPAEARCTYGNNPNCPRVFFKFLSIYIGLIDMRIDLERQRARFSGECDSSRASQENIITNHDIGKRFYESFLAESTKDLTDAEEEARLEELNRQGLVKEHNDETKKCRDNIENLIGEKCGLTRIRTEMQKVVGTNVMFFVDCEVGDWVEEECSVSCAGGVQKMTREITVVPNNGAGCPALETWQTCNEQPCPIDCKMSEWSGWSGCSVACGGGVQERSRDVEVEEQFGGEPCDEPTDTRACHVADCNKDCELSEWTPWTTCSVGCGDGFSKRTRSVVEDAVGDGECWGVDDPERVQTKSCTLGVCPVPVQLASCEAELDIIVLLEASSFLDADKWTSLKSFSANFARGMTQAGNNSLAFIKFAGPADMDDYDACANGTASDPEVTCGIKRLGGGFSSDGDALAAAIEGEADYGGTTVTRLAISEADELFKYGREGVDKILVLVTYTNPESMVQAMTAANNIKLTGVKNVIVEVGTAVDPSWWMTFPSFPSSQHRVNAQDWDFTGYVKVDTLIEMVCPPVISQPTFTETGLVG